MKTLLSFRYNSHRVRIRKSNKGQTLRLAISLAMVFLTSTAAWQVSAGIKNEANQLPAPLEQKVQELQTDLEKQGYKVARGEWNLFKIEDCQFALKSLGNCFGNNPAAPYVIPTVPLWPDEFVDESLRDMLGPTRGDHWWTFRMDQREALVVLGFLPPQGAYFGIQTYLFTREGVLNPADGLFHALTEPFMRDILFLRAPNPKRVIVFSSLGNSINNVVIERKSGAAFNQERAFIITPDHLMEDKLTKALLKAGVPDRKHIFVEPVSTELARLGTGPEADDLMTLIRYTFPIDEAAGERWRQNLPLAVLRVRDMNVSRATRAYPRPIREERKAHSEMGLSDSVHKLVEAVKQQWGQSDAFHGSFESLLLKVDLVGEHCLQRPMNCLGDTGDADYQISPTVNIDSGEVIAVMGTLGTTTGNATYTGLSVNRIPALVGVANISDNALMGSASDFAASVSHTDKLYLQYFARDCGNLPHCFEITEKLVPRGDSVKIIQRNYILPGSTRGPNPKLLVNPMVIVLDGKTRPAGP